MFNERLKEARIRAGYTQQQLGESVGKHKIFISQIENGYCLPTQKDLTTFCELLNITSAELEFPQVITSKKQVITRPPRKSNTSTYKLTVLLNRGDFPKLTKSNLKKVGYQNLQQFIEVAYQQLEQELKNQEAQEKLNKLDKNK